MFELDFEERPHIKTSTYKKTKSLQGNFLAKTDFDCFSFLFTLPLLSLYFPLTFPSLIHYFTLISLLGSLHYPFTFPSFSFHFPFAVSLYSFLLPLMFPDGPFFLSPICVTFSLTSTKTTPKLRKCLYFPLLPLISLYYPFPFPLLPFHFRLLPFTFPLLPFAFGI